MAKGLVCYQLTFSQVQTSKSSNHRDKSADEKAARERSERLSRLKADAAMGEWSEEGCKELA